MCDNNNNNPSKGVLRSTCIYLYFLCLFLGLRKRYHSANIIISFRMAFTMGHGIFPNSTHTRKYIGADRNEFKPTRTCFRPQRSLSVVRAPPTRRQKRSHSSIHNPVHWKEARPSFPNGTRLHRQLRFTQERHTVASDEP